MTQFKLPLVAVDFDLNDSCLEVAHAVCGMELNFCRCCLSYTEHLNAT